MAIKSYSAKATKDETKVSKSKKVAVTGAKSSKKSAGIDLELLVKAGAHLGHQTKKWDPKISEYLYGSDNGVHIFDLTLTRELLNDAIAFLKEAAKEGKRMVLVASKEQIRPIALKVAERAGIWSITERWLGGTLTNFDQIRKSLVKLDGMKESRGKGEFNKYTKKERLLLDREIERLERAFGGLRGLRDKPEVLIIVDLHQEKSACREAMATGVKTVGIVDSNCNPEMVDYPIPMNDDALSALEYVLGLLADAIVEGNSTSHKVAKDEAK